MSTIKGVKKTTTKKTTEIQDAKTPVKKTKTKSVVVDDDDDTTKPVKKMSDAEIYTLRRLQIETMTFECDKTKYNVLLNILKRISKFSGITVKYVTDFRNIHCDVIKENFEDIKTIFVDRAQKIETHFGVEIKFGEKDAHTKIISILRNITKCIDYKLSIRNDYISISHV